MGQKQIQMSEIDWVDTYLLLLIYSAHIKSPTNSFISHWLPGLSASVLTEPAYQECWVWVPQHGLPTRIGQEWVPCPWTVYIDHSSKLFHQRVLRRIGLSCHSGHLLIEFVYLPSLCHFPKHTAFLRNTSSKSCWHPNPFLRVCFFEYSKLARNKL